MHASAWEAAGNVEWAAYACMHAVCRDARKLMPFYLPPHSHTSSNNELSKQLRSRKRGGLNHGGECFRVTLATSFPFVNNIC